MIFSAILCISGPAASRRRRPLGTDVGHISAALASDFVGSTARLSEVPPSSSIRVSTVEHRRRALRGVGGGRFARKAQSRRAGPDVKLRPQIAKGEDADHRSRRRRPKHSHLRLHRSGGRGLSRPDLYRRRAGARRAEAPIRPIWRSSTSRCRGWTAWSFCADCGRSRTCR